MQTDPPEQIPTSFWLISENATLFCVGMTLGQGRQFRDEYNAFYRSIGYDHTQSLVLVEAAHGACGWADCGRFYVVDAQRNFHMLLLSPNPQMPPGTYGRDVSQEKRFTWEELKSAEQNSAQGGLTHAAIK